MTISMYHEVNETALYEGADGVLIPRIWANFVSGKIPIEELDNEELAEERLKNKNGTFAGGPPKAVPRALRKAMQTELQRRLALSVQSTAFEAVEVFAEAMRDTSADWRDRMYAARYLHERVVGKIPEKMEVTAEVKPWEGIVTGITNDLDQLEEE